MARVSGTRGPSVWGIECSGRLQNPSKRNYLWKIIEGISSEFTQIFNQAEQAEAHGLDELADPAFGTGVVEELTTAVCPYGLIRPRRRYLPEARIDVRERLHPDPPGIRVA